jgi:hypothetical protein
MYLNPNSRGMRSTLPDTRTGQRREGGDDPKINTLIKNKLLLWIKIDIISLSYALSYRPRFAACRDGHLNH